MEEKENKMIKDRKIKILTEQVESMRKRIEELESENKMLYKQIIIQQDVEHENVKQMNEVLADLYKKHDEYDDLIRRCKKTKESYEELNSEMAQIMNNYKKDMGRLERKIRFV